MTGVRSAFADAVRDAKAAWRARSTAWVAVLVAAALVPLVVSSPLHLQSWASGLYIAIAAVGLNFAMGLGGLSSLGQGAFVGVGAFGAAALRVHAGWQPIPATAAGVAIATAAGALVGLGAVRLRGPFVAVSTWIVAWLVGFVLLEFPRLSGGSQGLVVPPAHVGLPGTGIHATLSAGVHYEIGLVLLALALAAYARVARSAPGLALAAAREGPAQAAALGVDRFRLQLGAFTAAAFAGGLAGALAVQLAGVVDPTAYGPLLSVELFVAVLVGGAGRLLGPVVGTAVLAAVPGAARGLGSFSGSGFGKIEPVLAGALLLVALLIGRGGLVGLAETARRRLRPAPDAIEPAREAVAPAMGPIRTPDALAARDVSKRFGGVAALDGVSLELAPGRIHALLGPNGSGKSTLLRVLDGTVVPDAGAVALGARDLSTASTEERVGAGVVRTLQRTVVFEALTVRDHVVAGSTASRRDGAAARALLATPRYRAEEGALRVRAEEILSVFGLDALAGERVERIGPGERRLLMVATAFASLPSALLLDEPSAGMSAPESDRLTSALTQIARAGTAVLVVEHDFSLVRRLAETVTVLDAGTVIAEGTAAEVAADPAVRAAYLGDREG